MRKWRPPDAPPTEEWEIVCQIVLPKCCKKEVVSLAHESPMAGHLGLKYCLKMKQDVAEFCRTCHVC